MSDPKRLFIVGCPRSGTTWVRELLAQHPGVVAAGAETGLFSLYLRPLQETWDREVRRPLPDRGYGLSSVLDEAGFEALLRSVATQVLEAAAPAQPGRRVLVEKTPDHAEHAALILRLFPAAEFLHVIRDPRDVFCSFRGARSWTDAFPDNPIEAARRWRHIVRSGRQIATLTDRYTEVRYEALLADGPGELRRLFEWLDLAVEPGLCEAIVERSRIDTMRERHAVPAFFRSGVAGGWRGELTPSELRRLEHVAGGLMTALEYTRATKPSRFEPPRLWLRRRLEAVRSALHRRLGSWIVRL